MGKEIERKFLVMDDGYKNRATSVASISQGYLSTDPDRTVRVRIADDRGYLTIKSRNVGISRGEWEYEIPVKDARQLIALCPTLQVVTKKRYRVGRWEIDEFEGKLKGLTVAEIELSSEQEEFELPPFIGREVSGDPRYYNSSLASASEPPVEDSRN